MSYSTATRQNNYIGEATVTAFGTLGGTSGCIYTADKTVWVGPPIITNKKINGYTYYPGYQICPGNHYVNVTPKGTGASYANWTVQSGVPYYASGNQLDFTLYSSVSSITITANSSNNCGTGPNSSFYLTKKYYGCGGYYRILVYPNPASGEITIDATVIDAFDNSPTALIIDEVQLLENSNTVIRETPLKSNFSIKVDKLPEGEYYLHIRVGEDIFKRRIVINR